MMLIHEAVFVIGLIEEVENDMILQKDLIESTHPAVNSQVN